LFVQGGDVVCVCVVRGGVAGGGGGGL